MSTRYLGGTKESFTNSVGVELCWGWSPAVDLISLLNDRMTQEEKHATISSSSSTSSPATSSSSSFSGGVEKKKVAVSGFDEDGFPIVVVEEKANNIIDEGEEKNKNSNKKKPINILLMGAADVRHMVLTLSRMQRTELGKSGRPLHFYIFEPGLRVHCRHLLFLQLLLVDLVTLDELEDRVAQVLEIFGNSLLRDVTGGVLKNAALAVCSALDLESSDDDDDDDNNNNNNAEEKSNNDEKNKKSKNSNNKKKKKQLPNTKLASWLDWSNMKAREKDFIASQIISWTRTRTHIDIVSQWDSRVRTELAERYDNRVNIFDWDFHFALLDYSQLLRFPEYREFRKIGQAFDYCRINPRKGFRYEYNVPNKSLAQFSTRASVAAGISTSKQSNGGVYLGDVKNGPFFALGQDTENPHLKKREVDGTTIYGCGVIAMHNVRSWLYELVTGRQFPVNFEHKIAWEDDKHYNMLPPNSPEPHVQYEPEVAPCKFFPVGIDIEKFLEKIHLRQKQQHDEEERKEAKKNEEREEEGEGFFDAAFVGCTSTQWMNPTFFKCINKKHGIVLAETLKFVADAKEEAKKIFEQKILSEMANENGWKLDGNMTQRLHQHQMGPKKRPEGMELDVSTKKGIERQKIPHALVLIHKSTSVSAAPASTSEVTTATSASASATSAASSSSSSSSSTAAAASAN